MLGYRVITKEDYIKIRLDNVSACSISSKTYEQIDKTWDKLREG